MHVWFRVRHAGARLPKAVLWADGGKHSAVERLCDGSLIVAPPSKHSEGRKYQFADRRCSPAGLPVPAMVPGWLLEMPDISKKDRPVAPRRFDRDWLRRLPGKVQLARQWGLKLTGNVSRDGWHECHAIDRDDSHPSAAIHEDSGHYRDLGPSNLSLRFLDLAVQLGAYPDWKTAAVDLAPKDMLP
jgi:hypothetical protein